ncbi:MAG TPA: hypothetical protein VFJ92_04345 [Gemmatimonadales bacterium]|nr:hypothetical protein [Gemmatimonadales bacterium]
MDHSNDLNSIEGLGRLYRRRVDARNAPASGCVSPEAMLALLEREGSESERLATLDHVMSCAVCHREYEWLAAVGKAATEAGGRPAREALWRRAPLALAASLVAAVAAGFLVRGQMRGGGETVRGTTGDIVLAAPAAGVSSSDAPVFSWHPIGEASGYVLEIQGADRGVVRSDTTADTTLRLPSALPAGEYRWWVREVTDGSEPRSSAFRTLKIPAR